MVLNLFHAGHCGRSVGKFLFRVPQPLSKPYSKYGCGIEGGHIYEKAVGRGIHVLCRSGCKKRNRGIAHRTQKSGHSPEYPASKQARGDNGKYVQKGKSALESPGKQHGETYKHHVNAHLYCVEPGIRTGFTVP